METVMIRVGVVGVVMTSVSVLTLPSTTQPVNTTSMDDAPCGGSCPENSLCDIIRQECRFPCGGILCLPGDVCDSDSVTCQNIGECGDSCHNKHVSATTDFFALTIAVTVLVMLAFIGFGVIVCFVSHKNKKSQSHFDTSSRSRKKIEQKRIVNHETGGGTAQTEYGVLYQEDQDESPLQLSRDASRVTIDQHSVGSTNSGTGIIDSSSENSNPSVTSSNTGSMASMGSRDSGLGKGPDNETKRKQFMSREENGNDDSPPSDPGAQCGPHQPTIGPQWRENRHADIVEYCEKQKDLDFASSSSSNSSSYSVHEGDTEHGGMDKGRE